MKQRTTAALLTAFLGAALLVGCTDVPGTGPTPPEVNSETRFINADPTLASASIAFDLGPSVSGLAFGAATNHATYPSGARVGAVGADTLRLAMTTDQRATFVILPNTAGFQEAQKLIERRIFDAPAVTPGRIRVMHAAAPGGAAGPAVDVQIAGVDTTITLTNMSFREVSTYQQVPSGTYTVSVFAAGDTVAATSSEVSVSNSRYTSIITADAAGALGLVDLADN